jgi:hypothetical protein
LKKLVLTLALLTAGTSLAVGQARPAASRLGDLQIGATYSVANPDFGVTYIRGFGVYSDFDFLRHIGVEVDFRQLNDPDDAQPNRFSSAVTKPVADTSGASGISSLMAKHSMDAGSFLHLQLLSKINWRPVSLPIPR